MNARIVKVIEVTSCEKKEEPSQFKTDSFEALLHCRIMRRYYDFAGNLLAEREITSESLSELLDDGGTIEQTFQHI